MLQAIESARNSHCVIFLFTSFVIHSAILCKQNTDAWEHVSFFCDVLPSFARRFKVIESADEISFEIFFCIESRQREVINGFLKSSLAKLIRFMLRMNNISLLG